MTSRSALTLHLALPALVTAFAAPAHAGLPNLPAETAALAIVHDPGAAVKNAEAMAARAGLSPPSAPACWNLGHPALSWTAGQVDLSRPLYAAMVTPKKDKKGRVEPEILLYVPITKKANVEKLVQQISGKGRKLASRREGGYLVLSETKRRLAKRARRRAVPARALEWASELDVALFFDPTVVDDETATALVADGAEARTTDERIAKAAFETLLEVSRASTPKGEMSMLGVKLGKDGLRIRSRSMFVKDSEMGRWLLSMPKKTGPLLVGHPEGAILGGLATEWEAKSTIRFVKALHGRVVKRLSKKDRAELAPIEAMGPALAEAFTAHPGLSFTVRARPDGVPGLILVAPRVPDELRKQIPELSAVAADPKAKLPAHLRVELEAGIFAYLFDVGSRSVLAVNMGRLDLPDVLAAVKAGAAPVADVARYRTARAALPKSLVLEGYIDPGPLAELAMQSPEAAQFRPLARLVGGMPPIAVGVSVNGAMMESEIFVAEGLIGLVGMGFTLAAGAGSTGSTTVPGGR